MYGMFRKGFFMERTLFTPPMIETFRVCRRAYQLAYLSGRDPVVDRSRLSTLCKRFLLRALCDINRHRIQTLPQVQKYIGQNWPTTKLAAPDDAQGQENAIKAFRFVFRALCNYVQHPYKPQRSEVAAVSLKVRARVPYSKAYLEDTFDMILWHPEKRVLELVDFHINALKPFDPAWPAATLLIRQFLAQRLKGRWPFEKLVLTYCQLQSNGLVPVSIELDDSVVRLHWPELLKTINEMKSEQDYPPHRSSACKKCNLLAPCIDMGTPEHKDQHDSVSMSA
jgi:hypothetical protein